MEQVIQSAVIRNITQRECDLSYDATVTVFMQVIRILHALISVAGLASSTLFTYALLQKSSRNIHINLRLSLVSLTAANIIACIALLFMALKRMLLLLVANDTCVQIISTVECAWHRWPLVLAIYSCLAGIMCIAVERTIATVRYKTYEVQGSKIVGVTLVVVQWSLCLVLSVFSLYMRHDDGYLHYCTVYISQPKSSVVSLSLMCIIEVIVLIYFGALLNINKRKQVNEFVNNALHSLTERYQLLENVRSMQVLIPSLLLHATLTIVGLGTLVIFAIMYTELDGRTIGIFAPFSELVLLVIPCYSVVFPVVAVRGNNQMRSAMRCALPFLFKPRDEATVTVLQPPLLASRPSKEMELESDRHFGLLVKMWDK